VLMPDFRDDRAAGCISSQVGCAMGCDFCATTKTGSSGT
jgi:23S rRNA (adenine2503-C2)-methyltransferase